MSMVGIRCPSCGSPSSKGTQQDEYVCDHCGGKFTFVRPQDGVIIQDVKTHDCRICGRAVQAGAGNRCTHCNTTDLCGQCVQEVDHVLICRKCLKTEELECKDCEVYGEYFCGICKILHKKKIIASISRYCSKHMPKHFYTRAILKRDIPKKDPNKYAYVYYHCKNCEKGYDEMVCSDCIITVGRFIQKHLCKNCNERLQTNVKYFDHELYDKSVTRNHGLGFKQK